MATPSTPFQIQAAVDEAALLLHFLYAQHWELVDLSAIPINKTRCAAFITQGAAQGYTPSNLTEEQVERLLEWAQDRI